MLSHNRKTCFVCGGTSGYRGKAPQYNGFCAAHKLRCDAQFELMSVGTPHMFSQGELYTGCIEYWRSTGTLTVLIEVFTTVGVIRAQWSTEGTVHTLLERYNQHAPTDAENSFENAYDRMRLRVDEKVINFLGDKK